MRWVRALLQGGAQSGAGSAALAHTLTRPGRPPPPPGRAPCAPWRHHATLQPATRALRRIAGRIGETVALQRLPSDPRAMLDRLCDSWQAPVAGQRGF